MSSAKVERIEYDPNRTAPYSISLNMIMTNFSYIICPQNLKVGDSVVSSDKAEIKIGNCLKLKNMPTDTIIHNIELETWKRCSNFQDPLEHMDNLLVKMQIMLK